MKNYLENNHSDNVDKFIHWSLLAVLIVVSVVVLSYIFNFHKHMFSENPADWGTFGDYIGGLLNPCIALCALYWLTSSIKIQRKELTETREQFEQISQRQLEQISLQNFESLFFQLLETKDKALKDVLVKNIGESTLLFAGREIKSNIDKKGKKNEFDAYKDGEEFKKDLYEKVGNTDLMVGKESLRQHIILFKSLSLNDWDKFYTQLLLDYMGNYFRICYQIVKLIDSNELLSQNQEKGQKTILQKKYFDIFRATLTQYELEAFFFNCLSGYGNVKFKKMMEDYGLFEPLLIDINKEFEEMHRLTRYAYMYQRKAFEENHMFLQYFNDIEKLKYIDLEKLKDELYLMMAEDIINFSNSEVVEYNGLLKYEMRYGECEKFFTKVYFLSHFNISIFRYTFCNVKYSVEKAKEFWEKFIHNKQGYIDDFCKDNESKKDYYLKLIEIAKNISYAEEIDIIVKYRINIIEFLDYCQANKE